MDKLDRSSPPLFKQVETFDIPTAVERQLDNKIPLYIVNGGTQDLVKVEFLFRAGCWYDSQPLISGTVNYMLSEGTKTRSAAEIADQMDYYGAFFQTENGGDWSSVTLYTLTKYLNQTLPIVKEVLTNSVFPENELQTYIQNRKLRLLVDNERVDFIARKKFVEQLFGADHPYGFYATANDYDKLERNALMQFYASHYTPDNCKIIVSGKVSEEVIAVLNAFFGASDWSAANEKFQTPNYTIKPIEDLKQFYERQDAIQSGIRIGKLMFNKTHPDYYGMQILNTVLGGYFGSRLMTNIREDKGYTYGIGSAISSNINGGYFFITTETGVDVCQKAIDEIYFEIKRLRTELIPEEELALVKNYILGTFLRSIDGPFELAEKLKGILTYGLGYDYYFSFIKAVHTTTPELLRGLAEKYLHEESMLELVVGKK